MKALGICIADGHGAPEFRLQALAWQQWMNKQGNEAVVVELPVASLPIAQRYGRLLHVLADHGAFGQLALFCHGWSTGLQLVPKQRVKEFAACIQRNATAGCVVTLYACSTGSDMLAGTSEVSGEGPGGDGGFADRLRDALCAAGDAECCVDAHTVLGHLARNPYVRRFAGNGVPTGGVGGSWLVTPKSVLWPRWVRALKGDFRWEFPHLDVTEIHERLAADVLP